MPQETGVYMKTFQYTYEFKPMIYDYIMRDLTLNENKKEKKILELLVKGKTCEQIGEEVGYSSRTIVRRRKALYEKTKELMFN